MNYAILLSGGVGTRISSEIPKQYIRVNGQMMVTAAMRTLFLASQVGAVCVIADVTWRQEILEDLRASLIADTDGAASETDPLNRKQIFFAEPGNNRQLSIWNGLQEILREREASGNVTGGVSDKDTVFIHDAARPYLTQKLIDVCYEALPGHDGVLPVLPMKDTVYESADGRTVGRLLDRSRIFAGQAPELFLLESYVAANQELLPDRILSINGSTEPAIMAGMDVVMIPGDEKNRKVTTDTDLEEYRSIYQRKQ